QRRGERARQQQFMQRRPPQIPMQQRRQPRREVGCPQWKAHGMTHPIGSPDRPTRSSDRLWQRRGERARQQQFMQRRPPQIPMQQRRLAKITFW
ncbi:hypothetical protein, partial [Corynebacterium glutamicum]|uniref:hypothetical protein n=1 Tax=Corynebacterium glutamicum TaxID=1718 RepID=UPI0009590CD7